MIEQVVRTFNQRNIRDLRGAGPNSDVKVYDEKSGRLKRIESPSGKLLVRFKGGKP